MVGSDFSCMLGSEEYERFVAPGLELELDYLEASMYHLDGPAAARQHLERILQFEKLDGVQWVYGAGQPSARHWLPLLRQIQAAGKRIQVHCEVEDLVPVCEALRPRGRPPDRGRLPRRGNRRETAPGCGGSHPGEQERKLWMKNNISGTWRSGRQNWRHTRTMRHWPRRGRTTTASGVSGPWWSLRRRPASRSSSSSSAKNPLARYVEGQLLQTIRAKELIGDDKVVPDFFRVPVQIESQFFGVERHRTVAAEGLGYHDEPVLVNLEEDLSKLRPSEFHYNKAATERLENFAGDILGDVLPLRRVNELNQWHFAPTQHVVNLMGMENLFLAMFDAPEALHRLMAFLVEDMRRLLRWEEQEGLLFANAGNDYMGSGSYCFNRELPASGPVVSTQTWGHSNSQESVGISPEQYAEFVFPLYPGNRQGVRPLLLRLLRAGGPHLGRLPVQAAEPAKGVHFGLVRRGEDGGAAFQGAGDLLPEAQPQFPGCGSCAGRRSIPGVYQAHHRPDPRLPRGDHFPGHLHPPRQPRQGPPRCGDRAQFTVTGFLSQWVEVGKSRCRIGSCNGFLFRRLLFSAHKR